MSNANWASDPITPADLKAYRKLLGKASKEVKSAGLGLIRMLEVFWETPASQLTGIRHQSGVGQIVPLEPAEIQRIWDYVPDQPEIDQMSIMFETLPAGALRNAVHFLLWYAVELSKDREPITTDTLKG